MRHCAGQSMAEFAAGAAALSLLLLGTLTLGAYQEVDRRGVVASRQSAWLHGWTPGGVDVNAAARLLHQDLFDDVGVRAPRGDTLLVGQEDVQLTAGHAPATGVAGAAAAILLAPLRASSGFLGAAFDLRDGSLNQGSVRSRIAPVATLSAPFNEMELQLQAPYALLADAWHASGPAHVRQRAGGLVPATALRSFNDIWRPLSVPLGIVEPSLRHLCLGLIEPDRIPEDRLGPGRTPLPEDCR